MTSSKPPHFYPSKMERILACPGSFPLEEAASMPVAPEIPPAKSIKQEFNKSSKYIDEGHAAHQLAQYALTDGQFNTRVYLGHTITVEGDVQVRVTEEMCKHVQTYVDAVHNRIEDYKKQANVKNVMLLVEERIDTSPVIGLPQQSGTADVVMIVEYKNGSGLISVEDLKYGMGVPVVAQDNAQLMTYGAALLSAYGKKLDIKKVNLVIHMPRLGYESTHTVTAAQLKTFAKTVKKSVAEAMKQREIFEKQGINGLTLVAGKKQCQFCKARSICPAFNAMAAQKKQQTPTTGAKKKKTPKI